MRSQYDDPDRLGGDSVVFDTTALAVNEVNGVPLGRTLGG
jgi:hypothetical protein